MSCLPATSVLRLRKIQRQPAGCLRSGRGAQAPSLRSHCPLSTSSIRVVASSGWRGVCPIIPLIRTTSREQAHPALVTPILVDWPTSSREGLQRGSNGARAATADRRRQRDQRLVVQVLRVLLAVRINQTIFRVIHGTGVERGPRRFDAGSNPCAIYGACPQTCDQTCFFC
jgi:hypothetical protein